MLDWSERGGVRALWPRPGGHPHVSFTQAAAAAQGWELPTSCCWRRQWLTPGQDTSTSQFVCKHKLAVSGDKLVKHYAGDQEAPDTKRKSETLGDDMIESHTPRTCRYRS